MAQPVTVQPAAPARRARGNPWLTLCAVGLGAIMVLLDGTVVAIANPAIGRELGASLSDLQWVTSGYLLALAVFMITAGKLGDLFGHKKVFLLGVAGFAASSLAIGLTGSIGWLIAFRVLQGLFGALLNPASLALLRVAFPGDRLNVAFGVWGAVMGLSSAAGPIVGGVLVEQVNWQSVFFINVPIGIAAILLGLWVLAESRAEQLSRIDGLGVVLLSGAMFCLVWAIIKAPEYGWGDGRTLGFFAAAVVIGALFVAWQARAAQPLLPLGLFRNASVSIGTVLMILVSFSMLGAMFFVTFFFQGVHGLSPLEAGLRMLPMSAGMIVASPLAGLAQSKLGPRIPMAVGMLITALAMFLLSRLELDASYLASAVPFTLLAFGLSPVMVGATQVIVGNAPGDLSGVASGLQQSAMQVGGALGTAVLGAVITAKVTEVLPRHFAEVKLPVPPAEQVDRMAGAVAAGVVPAPEGTPPQVLEAITQAAHLSFLDGMHFGFLVSTAIAVCAAVLSLFVKAGRRQPGDVPVHLG
jgi:EmrB/QacA subfamily drug resistance transporter